MDKLTRKEKARLKRMYHELCESEHLVVLVPAEEERHHGHKLRALASGNAAWYTRFNRNFMNARGKMLRARTFISKKYTLLALERMLKGNLTGVYAARLLWFIRLELANEAEARKPKKHNPDDWMPF